VKQSPFAGRPGRPVFVGGCPRSGTTLVRTMLNSHPELAMPHETKFLIDAFRMRKRWGDLTLPENRERLARWVVNRKTARSGRIVRDPEQIVRTMVAAPPTIGSVLGAPFSLYADVHDKPRWGDKRPSYVVNLDAIFAMFPDAQFVNVVRDPRDVAASIRRVELFREPVVAGADVWARSQRWAGRWSRRLATDQFLEIRYEDLVADGRAVLERVAGFLGLDPAGIDSMLAFHEHADTKRGRMHPLVHQPLTTQTLRSYERALEPAEIALIERELARPMRRYGYEPSHSDVAIPAELRARMRRRRQRMRKLRTRRRALEHARRVTYRHPLAAVYRERVPAG
jgi:hypothetical protein